MKTTLFDSDSWHEIFATLSRNKTRTFLTAFGIFWGTAMLAMLHGGATGLEGTMMRNFSSLPSTNLGAVTANVTSMPYHGYNKGMKWQLTMTDAQHLAATSKALDKYSPLVGRYSSIAYGSKSKSASMIGANADLWQIQEPNLIAGRLLNASDVNLKAKNVVMGLNIANELFGSDPEKTIGKYVNANNIYYQVVGVASQKGEGSIMNRVDDSMYMPITTMASAYNTNNKIDFLIYTAKDGYTPRDVFNDLRRVVRASHPIHPDDEKAFMFMDISEVFNMVGNVFTGIDLLALFVGIGTLIAGIIGVGNIMWVIVRERTNEIGIRRAIGAKPRDIIIQILSESMVLTVVAGTAGIVFAAHVLAVLDSQSYSPELGSAGFQLTFGSSVTILATFLVLGTAAGLIPAIKAMRIKPVEAMRGK